MEHPASMLALLLMGTLMHAAAQKELRWDWSRIDPLLYADKPAFPGHFQFCVATSEYQVSGNACFDGSCPESNWSRYEQRKDTSGRPLIEPVGRGVDHWNRVKEDVGLIKQLGVSVYRCSLDWARVQPREGEFDLLVLEHYHTLFDELRHQGIKLMVTLHHFVNPAWFEDKGAFEKAENIAHFVAFAQRMFTEFSSKVSYWCTINEPGVYAAQAYVMRAFPRPAVSHLGFPCNLGRGMCLYGACLVIKHLMMAHIEVYKALKALPGGKHSRIGIVHNIIHFEPYHPSNVLERGLAFFLRWVYCDSITRFLLTGDLVCKTYTGNERFSYPAIKEVQDFIGLNYYSHVLINWKRLSPSLRPEDHEIATDMQYGVYPEGLYRALKELAPLNKPIYITENGLADEQDRVRDLWYRRYLYAVRLAISEGVDVRMFCAWSLFDNYEWNLGFAKKFGLYAVDPKTYNRSLKPGATYLRDLAREHRAKQAA